MAQPKNYQEILSRGHMRDRDFRVTFGDKNIARCLLVAPHGGGIEPGTSEIVRALADTGTWAWYEFAGFLRKGNQEGLHITSTLFDEPTLLTLLPRTQFVVAIHGANEALEQVVYIGGRWKEGRETLTKAINDAQAEHGIQAMDAPERLRSEDSLNLTNRGTKGAGVQLEFTRGARNLLFPPDCSREARGKRSTRLNALARALGAGLKKLV